MDPNSLSDVALIATLKKLAAEERRNLRAFIEHLKVFDERGLAAGTEHATTFMYCTKELKLTEGEAYRRMQVAGVIDRFPRLLDLIEDGSLTLTTASVLAPHLNKANFDDLTRRSAGQPRREVEFIVASLAPKHLPFDVVRPIGVERTSPPEAPTPTPAPAEPTFPSTPDSPARVEPLSAEAARVHFTATRGLLDKIERARALLRHKFPSADYNDIFDEALDALLDHEDPDRKAAPAPVRGVLPDRRRIPQWVKDIVWRRDTGRCSFLSQEGARCGETAWLEYDHITPFAQGGKSDDPDNVRLLCRAHNLEAAAQAGLDYR